jgi:hypothetical protein
MSDFIQAGALLMSAQPLAPLQTASVVKPLDATPVATNSRRRCHPGSGPFLQIILVFLKPAQDSDVGQQER